MYGLIKRSRVSPLGFHKPRFSRFVVGTIFCLTVGSAQAAVQWLGNYKVLQVVTTISGDLLILLDQVITTNSGCAPNAVIIIPKWIPSANVTVSDSVLARMQALAQSAKAQNATIAFGIESSYGCMWGSYPIVIQINENK